MKKELSDLELAAVKARNKLKRQQRTAARKLNNECVQCGHKLLIGNTSKRLCFKCLDNANKYSNRYRDKQGYVNSWAYKDRKNNPKKYADMAMETYYKRKHSGKCTACSMEAAEDSGWCVKHKTLKRQDARDYQARLRAKQRANLLV
jgi:hypothetical protein